MVTIVWINCMQIIYYSYGISIMLLSYTPHDQEMHEIFFILKVAISTLKYR